MSVTVKIKEKGLFKKKLDIENIIFENMSYGTMDESYRLVEKEIGKYTIAYRKNNIGRGFEVQLQKGMINLRMNFPTSNDEIRFFYSYVKRICELLHTTIFEREEEFVSVNDVNYFIELDIKTSKDALEKIKEDIETDRMNPIYLFGALNPITIGEKEISIVGNDTEKLVKLFHELQSIDAYYAAVKVYQKQDESLFGIYVLTENVLSIFPFKPGLFMNNKLKIDKFYVSFVFDNELKGCMLYEDFMANVDITKSYDTEHFLISLNKRVMKELLEKYKKKL